MLHNRLQEVKFYCISREQAAGNIWQAIFHLFGCNTLDSLSSQNKNRLPVPPKREKSIALACHPVKQGPVSL